MRFPVLFLLLGLFVLISCNSEPENNKNDNTSIDLSSENSIEPPRTLEHLPPEETKASGNTNPGHSVDYNYEKDFEAIVIGDGVRFRDAPNRGSNVVFSSQFGDLVHIIKISEDRETISDEPLCDSYGYHWYKTIGANGKEGWVFGKFLYIRPDIGQLPDGELQNWLSRLSDKEYMINGTTYRFDLAIDQSIGASDEDGLTGCDQYAFPVFYVNDKPAVNFIRYKEIEAFDGRLQSGRGLLRLLWSSEGGHDDITGIEIKSVNGEEVLELKIKHFYQDGASESTIIISENNATFQLKSGTNSGVVG